MKKSNISLLLIGLFLVGCTTQMGSSRDVIYGYDQGPAWNHMYLKNDHTTTYCFDNRLLDKVKAYYDNQTVVKISYAKGTFYTGVCMGQGNSEVVLVNDITNE